MNQLITVKLLYINDFYNSSHFLTSQCINPKMPIRSNYIQAIWRNDSQTPKYRALNQQISVQFYLKMGEEGLAYALNLLAANPSFQNIDLVKGKNDETGS